MAPCSCTSLQIRRREAPRGLRLDKAASRAPEHRDPSLGPSWAGRGQHAGRCSDAVRSPHSLGFAEQAPPSEGAADGSGEGGPLCQRRGVGRVGARGGDAAPLATGTSRGRLGIPRSERSERRAMCGAHVQPQHELSTEGPCPRGPDLLAVWWPVLLCKARFGLLQYSVVLTVLAN